jgi:trigger factor
MNFQFTSTIILCMPFLLAQSFHIPSSVHRTSSSWQLYFSTNGNVVTRLENSSVSIAIPVPGDATKAAYDKVCTELSKTIQIPGFRKGSKLPPQILEQSMAAQGGRNALKVQAINELLSTLVEPALREQALDPIGQPRLSPSAEVLAETYTPGEPLSLIVECDVWPEITWNGQYQSDLSGTYQRKPVDPTKLNKALDDLKERYVTMEPIMDPNHVLQMGDACTVNMVGYMATNDDTKGELLPNAASGDRVEVVLGSGRYMEGLVEGLIGAKVGETVEIRVTFPDVCNTIFVSI